METVLSDLSEASFQARLPVMLYLSLVGAVGLAGNSLVLLVYWCRYKPSATRAFILAIALCDLTTNTVGLPLQIATIRYAYDLDNYWLCRGSFASATLSARASGFLLAVVALDRRRRICMPLKKHLNAREGLAVAVATVSLSVAIFAPFVPLYGIHRVNTTVAGVQARMCWIEDKYKDTVYPLAYEVVVYLAFFVGLAVMVTSYIFVGVKVWKRKRLGRLPASRPEERQEPVEQGPNDVAGAKKAVIRTNSKSGGTLKRRLTTYTEFRFGEDQCVECATEVDTLRKLARLAKEKVDRTAARCDSDRVEDSTSFSPGPDVSETGTRQRRPENSNVTTSTQPAATHIRQAAGAGGVHVDVPLRKPPEHVPFKPDRNGGAENNAAEPGLENDEQPSPKGASSNTKGSSEVIQPETLTTLERVKRKPIFRKVSQRTRRLRSRTTLMMSVLTFFYVINWLPHLVMRYRTR